MSANYTIRRATVDDIAVIVHQRAGMFTDMGSDPGLIQAMEVSFRAWVSDKLNDESYLGWLAVAEGGQVVAGAGLWLNEWIPSPLAPSIVRGYILNVYTEQAYRKRGIARRLVEEILAYCRAHTLQTIVLHASKQGRPIYEALGFQTTNEMRLNL